jgi:hypothetical protein
MKILAYVSVLALFISGCSHKQEQQIKSLSDQDSTLMKQSGQKDSTILTYVKSMNDIQDILDSIKTTEKMLTVNMLGGEIKSNTINDIRGIEAQLIKYHKEIYSLQNKVKSENTQNNEIQRMNKHLTEELAERDSGIVVLQQKLLSTNDSLKTVVQQFNDSMLVMTRQKNKIQGMTTVMHMVYYVVGTNKELKKDGVVTNEGGFVGIGKTASIKKDFNAACFTNVDMTQVRVIALNKRFEKIVTNHPSDSYSVTDNKKSDSLIITDAVSFWSASKYLVVVVRN